MVQNTFAYTPVPVTYGYGPESGPKTVFVKPDFSEKSVFDIDLDRLIENGNIEFIQSVFVDNTDSSQALIIEPQMSQQRIVVPASWQGYFPLFAKTGQIKVTCADNTAQIGLNFNNFPVPAMLWNEDGTQVTVSGTVTVRPAGSTGNDESANKPVALSTLLGTLAVNSSRNSCEVQNQSAIQLQVRLDDGAGGEESVILLASGGAVNTQGASWKSETFRGRVRVYGTAGTDQVMIRED